METFYTTTGYDFSAGHYLWDRVPHGKVEKFVRKLRYAINSTHSVWVLELILRRYIDVEIKRFGEHQSSYGNIATAMVRERRIELLAMLPKPPQAKAVLLGTLYLPMSKRV